MQLKNSTFLLLIVLLAVACRLSPEGQILTDLDPGGVPLPPDEDYGVLCFVELSHEVVASAPVFNTYTSQDGGLTWQHYDLDPMGISGSGCTPSIVLQRELWATPDGSVRYRFEAGQSIEVSYDQGMSWQLAYDLVDVSWEPANPSDLDREIIVQPAPLDAMIDPHSGNLLLAMGHAGVLVRLLSSEWRWVSVGQHENPEFVLTPVPMS